MSSDPIRPNQWTGKVVRLRAWRAEDWEAQLHWREDTEGERANSYIPLPMSESAARRLAEERALHQPDNDGFEFIIETLDGETAGVIGAHDCDPRNGTFSYGLYVAPEYRRRGCASEAVLILLRFFFEERRYQKADAGVYDYNQGSIALHEKLGFKIEGRSRRLHYSAGAYHDLLRYGLTVEEFHERYGRSERLF
jgi:RimJ/RimL family protein N-acetyltransferase